MNKQIDVFLITKKILLCITILWSSSVMSFSSNNSYTIHSDDDCRSGDYETVKQQIEDFQNYHSIDNTIRWWEINFALLSPLDGFKLGVLSKFRNIRVLDMTVSFVKVPQELSNSEQKRRLVWLAFSPLELPRESHRFYPKVPLVCDISEGNNNVVHTCNQTTGLTYAFQSFSSNLTVTKDEDEDCVMSSYRVSFVLDSQHIDNIYKEAVEKYPLLNYDFLNRFDRQSLFSLYFKHFYNELLSM